MYRAVLRGKGRPIVKYKDSLPWAVQKRLNRQIYHLYCGLGWAEGSTSSIVFTRWRQCAHMGGHFGATWRIRLNRPSAAVMRSYVNLHWPLVNLLRGWFRVGGTMTVVVTDERLERVDCAVYPTARFYLHRCTKEITSEHNDTFS